MASSDLVVKTNKLNSALQNLSLAEIRIIQLAIIDARETGKGLSPDTPLTVDAKRYAEVFKTTRQNAYSRIKEAEETLFNRRFTVINDDGTPRKSRWVSQVDYIDSEGEIKIVLTPEVVRGIIRIDGAEQFFTKYLLSKTVELGSSYSIRLYELLVQWKKAKATPLMELETFRQQLGLTKDQYTLMSNFKSRVLESGIDEINKKTDLTVSYKQVKSGKKIIGFKFTVKVKDSDKENLITVKSANPIDGLTDAQIGRITRNPAFISDYNHLINANSEANKSDIAWTIMMSEMVKTNPMLFDKRPIKEYLEY